MERKLGFYVVPALLLAVIAAGLLRRCDRGPVVIQMQARPPAARPVRTSSEAAPAKIGGAPGKSGLTEPKLLNLDEFQTNIRKYYPAAEHKAGKEGHVTMSLVVGADGAVSEARVQASGGADFDEAAEKAVAAMRFAPARKAGVPIAVEISERIDFQYDGK